MLALATAGVLAPAAGAATRHVTPDGAASGGCERSAPCSIAWAVNGGGSGPGDVVVLAPGIYADQPLVVPRELTVTAREDRPRPLVEVATPGGVALTVTAGGAGSVIEHLSLRAPAPARAVVEVAAAVSLEDLVARTDTATCLRTAAAGLRLEDVTFVRSGAGAGPCLETLGRDTAWTGVTVAAPGTDVAAAYQGNGTLVDGVFRGGRTGLRLAGRPIAHRLTASGAYRALSLTGDTLVTDSVAVSRGGGVAVHAGRGEHTLLNLTAWATGPGAIGIHAADRAVTDVRNAIATGREADLAADGATLRVRSSIFRTGRGIADEGRNVAVPPLLADPAAGDFRPRPGSPAVDAGSFETNAGGADRAGRFRWLGSSPDIGAYEHAPRRPSRPRLDRRAPRLAGVELTSARFRAGRRGTAFTAAAVPTGTVLRFLVSESSDLVLTVARRGRSQPVLGTIVLTVARGAGRTKLSGELGGRLLAPGRYVLTVTARDPTQNLSRPVRIAFRVVQGR